MLPDYDSSTLKLEVADLLKLWCYPARVHGITYQKRVIFSVKICTVKPYKLGEGSSAYAAQFAYACRVLSYKET
jgi:hypothetical protein